MKLGNTIPLRFIRFTSPQDGPGLSVVSSCRAIDPQGHITRWVIDYVPVLRSFRIEYTPPAGSGPKQVEFIPEHRVSSWAPVETSECSSNA